MGMEPYKSALIGLGAAAAGLAVLWPLAVWYEVRKCERPAYRVLRTLGTKKDRLTGRPLCELREYAPTLVAETTTSGTQQEASRRGFRAIAGFIFGRSQQQVDGKPAPIAMTSPVRMDMRGAEALPPEAEATVRMAFYMPSKYTKDTLPKPAPAAGVVVRELPAHQAAALAFRGRVDRATVARKAQELRAAMKEAGLEPAAAAPGGGGGGDPGVILFQYYPPFTWPIQRVNEVLLEVKRGPAQKQQ